MVFLPSDLYQVLYSRFSCDNVLPAIPSHMFKNSRSSCACYFYAVAPLFSWGSVLFDAICLPFPNILPPFCSLLSLIYVRSPRISFPLFSPYPYVFTFGRFPLSCSCFSRAPVSVCSSPPLRLISLLKNPFSFFPVILLASFLSWFLHK